MMFAFTNPVAICKSTLIMMIFQICTVGIALDVNHILREPKVILMLGSQILSLIKAFLLGAMTTVCFFIFHL